MTAGAQVMVVEDEGLVALSLQRKLEKLGYRVPAVVASGEEAVELAGNLSPDLVLMDIMLDGALDGIDAASRLRERLDVPIVFLTAYSDDMTIERAKTAEPFGYLVKPCEDRELRTTIEMALNKHRTEREVRESERRLATTLKSIGDAVIITDVNASVTFMNPFAESMTGWPAGEAVGRHVTEVFDLASEGIPERTEHPVEKSLREGIVVALSDDTILRSRDGIGRPIDDSVAPIRDDRGHTRGAILVFRDTSERRRTEVDLRRERDNLQGLVEKLSRELSEAMKLAGAADRARSEFLATMSHELRTPLVGVLGTAELLRGTGLSRKQRHYTDVVLDSGRSLLALIDDILEFASIEAKKPGAEPVDFAVRTMMEETVGLVRHRAAAKGLTLSLDVAPDVAPVVSGDRSRLQQVLLRLISNAIKFTDTGRIEVRVQAAGGDDHEVLLRFEVEDTGIGISPRDQAMIFDPFAQADRSTTRRHGGLGLGLAVAARMVEIMGGTLGVRSEAGKGSCFFFVLPFRNPAPDARVSQKSSSQLPHETPMFDAEILVAEDNVVNREVVKAMLECLGCSVTLVTNGREALAATDSHRYDAVLMDCFMPDFDGFDATAALREREEKVGGGHVPIIAMTADVEDSFRERCLASGMDAYLSKPFDQKQLASVLARFIPRRSAHSRRNRIP